MCYSASFHLENGYARVFIMSSFENGVTNGSSVLIRQAMKSLQVESGRAEKGIRVYYSRDQPPRTRARGKISREGINIV